MLFIAKNSIFFTLLENSIDLEFWLVQSKLSSSNHKPQSPCSCEGFFAPTKIGNTDQNKRPPSIIFKFQRKYLITKKKVCTSTKTACISQKNEM